MTPWIPLKDELPEYGDMVVLWDASFERAEIRLINFDPQNMGSEYTHWFMLPTAPRRTSTGGAGNAR